MVNFNDGGLFCPPFLFIAEAKKILPAFDISELTYYGENPAKTGDFFLTLAGLLSVFVARKVAREER